MTDDNARDHDHRKCGMGGHWFKSNANGATFRARLSGAMLRCGHGRVSALNDLLRKLMECDREMRDPGERSP